MVSGSGLAQDPRAGFGPHRPCERRCVMSLIIDLPPWIHKCLSCGLLVVTEASRWAHGQNCDACRAKSAAQKAIARHMHTILESEHYFAMKEASEALAAVCAEYGLYTKGGA